MQDNKRLLYDALSADYDLGTFEQFSADIEDENKRRKLYDATAEDYDYGDYDSFSKQLGFGAAAPVDQPSHDPQKVSEGRAMFNSAVASRKPETSSYEQAPEATKEYIEQNPAQGGKVEWTPEAIAQRKAVAMEEVKAESDFVNEYDQRWAEYQADVDNELSGPEVDEKKKWLDENNQRYREAKDAISEVEGKFNIGFQDTNLERLAEKKKENQSHVNPRITSSGGMAPAWYAPKEHDQAESENYEAANEIISMAEQTYKQGSKSDPGYDGNWLEKAWTAASQFVEGGANNFDMGSLTFGLSEGSALTMARRTGDKYNKIVSDTLKDMGYSDKDVKDILQSGDAEKYYAIVSRIDSALDEKLTDGERAILDALEEFTAAKMARANDVSIASAAGAGAEQSAEFMLDFILTGGMAKAGTKAATKLASTRLLKKLGEKGAKAVAKGLADAGVAAARTAAMFPRNLSAYGENLIQMNPEMQKDELGRYNFDRSHLNAALNTALTQYIEYWSEGFGEYFGAGERALFKKVTKAAPKTAIGKTLNQYRGSIGKYLDYGKFDGMFNEMLEEVVGSGFNALAGWMSGDRIGDQEAMKDFFSGEQLATLALSFLPMSAISARTNIKAYNTMKNRYNDAVKALNPFINSGAISRDELDELVGDIADKTPEEIKDKIVEISDKARKSEMAHGVLPANFAQSLLGYVEGTFAMQLENETWENSQEKMAVVDAYTSQYDNPDERNAYDLNQLEAETRAAATAAGFDEDMLNQDSYMMAKYAQSIQEEQPEQSRVLLQYAQAKAANAGLRAGYNEETRAMFDEYENVVRSNADNNGNVILATMGNGRAVLITSNDATVGPDGEVSVPTGADGLVTFINANGGGAVGQAKAGDFSGATSIPTDFFVLDQKQKFFEYRDDAFVNAENTISPAGQQKAIASRIGQNVFIRGGGAFEPVQVVRMTNNGQNVVVTGDKEALKGVAIAAGIDTPGGQNLEIPVQSLYPMLSTEADGSLTTDQPEAQPEATEETAPNPQPQKGGLSIDGRPISVIGENGEFVEYTYKDDPDAMIQTMDTDEFKSRTGYGEAPAETQEQVVPEPVVEEPVVEEAPQPAEEANTIPLDEKTGEPIYDSGAITPVEAWDAILNDFEGNEEDALGYMQEQADAVAKALKKAKEAVAKGEEEKAQIDNLPREKGEGPVALKNRKESAKDEIDKNIAKYRESIPELERRNAFWDEFRKVLDKMRRQKDAQERLDLEPRDLRELISETLPGFFKSGGLLYLPSVLRFVGENMRKELLTKYPGCFTDDEAKGVSIDDFATNILAGTQYGYMVTDSFDAADMASSMLVEMGRKEMSNLIKESREAERKEAEQYEDVPEPTIKIGDKIRIRINEDGEDGIAFVTFKGRDRNRDNYIVVDAGDGMNVLIPISDYVGKAEPEDTVASIAEEEDDLPPDELEEGTVAELSNFSGIEDRRDDEKAKSFVDRVLKSIYDQYRGIKKGDVLRQDVSDLPMEEQVNIPNARYNSKSKKIIIFAKSDTVSSDAVQRSIFHEAIHRSVRGMTAQDKRHVVALFNAALPFIGYYTQEEYDDKYNERKKIYLKHHPNISNKALMEEMLAFELSDMMTQGTAGEWIDIMRDADSKLGSLLDRILNEIGYETETESNARAERANSEAPETEGNLQGISSGNGERVVRDADSGTNGEGGLLPEGDRQRLLNGDLSEWENEGEVISDEISSAPFYSNAEKSLESIKTEKATPRQWLAMLEKAGGIKAGEDKWIGLSDWLKASDKKTLTKQEVADFVAQHKIQIASAHYAEGGSVDQLRELYPNWDRAFYVEDGEVNINNLEEAVELYNSENITEPWLHAYGSELEEGDEGYDRLLDWANSQLAGSGAINPTRLSYTTPGLRNKREIAMTVPTIEPWNEDDNIHFGDAGNGRAIAWARFGDAYMPGEELSEQEKEGLPEYAKNRALHHAPKKVLFIDEIQSKRHQEGREHGYQSDTPDTAAPLREELAKKERRYAEIEATIEQDYDNDLTEAHRLRELQKDARNAAEYEQLEQQIQAIYDRIHSRGGEYNRLRAEIRELQDRIEVEQRIGNYRREGRIPDAPFEKNWHELAMKRMLRLAAEEGYDYVAWTTGDQQAERYNIGGVLKSVERRESNNLHEKDFTLNLNEHGTQYLTTDEEGNVINTIVDDFRGKKLSDIVGKELAVRMLQMEENDVIEGDGLRIGGEGMKGFYDDILPRFMNKYGKKWGVKVEDKLVDLNDGAHIEAHILPVTPEMKESVMQGQLLFRDAYHGSGADFERFDHSHMSEGSGSQVYGWGTYVTSNKDTARSYAESVGGHSASLSKTYYDGKIKDLQKTLKTTRNKQDRARIQKMIEYFEQRKEEAPAASRHLYSVEIPDDNGQNYIHWDAPLTNEQSDKIMQEVREQVGDDWGEGFEYELKSALGHGTYGKYVESGLNYFLGDQKDYATGEDVGAERNAKLLHSLGFVGIEIPVDYQGGQRYGGSNYVIFDENDIEIVDHEKFRESPEAQIERRITDAEREVTNGILDTMSRELGIKINRVSRSDMPAGHESDKGYYDTGTGEVTICMDNVADERDAVATVFHESVGHHGLRKLFGPRFREAMARIYAALDTKGRAWVNNYIVNHPGLDNVRAVEEYLSYIAESGDFKKSTWDKIKEIFGRIIDKLFGTDGFVFTDNELNYILRASYEHLKDPNWLNTFEGKAKDTLMKYLLGINETDPNKPTDPEGPRTGRLYRDGETGVANEDYEREMDSKWNSLVTENQNADLPVKIGMDKVMKEVGKEKLEENEDYLTRHNLASSRAESEAHEFELSRFRPMLDQVRVIRDKLTGKKSNKEERQKAYERVLDYLYAVSGLERNAYKNGEIDKQMSDALDAARNRAEEEREKVRHPEGYTLTPELQDKLIKEIDDKLAEEEKGIVKKYQDLKRDWSGLTSLMGLRPSLLQAAETKAQAMVEDFKRDVGDDAALDELWTRIRACTDFSLEHAYKHGLLTRDEFEKLHGTASRPRMWEYYLPLRGFKEETAEDQYSYERFANPSLGDVVVKKANGRWTEADNPIANILNVAETEIVQGKDNWAKQALYRFVLNAGENSLLTEVEPWYVKDPATGNWSIAEPYGGESLEDFENRMQQNRTLYPDNYKKGRRGLRLDRIMANKAHRNEHMIRLKVGGVDKMIWVNGDPALAKAVTGMSRAQNLQWIRRASRALSNLFTTYSLDFTAKNLLRDTIYSQIALLVKEDRPYRQQYRKNWIKNFGYGLFAYPMIQMAAQWEDGRLLEKEKAGTLNPRESMFLEFMRNGGQTGYTIVNSVSQIKKDLEKSMRRAGSASYTFPVFGHYAKAVKTLNEAFELLTRFTAYQTSRDMGRSGQRSASDAKEISVNFNRRGAQSGEGFFGALASYLGATHYFYNAGVQGFDNFLRLFKVKPVTMSAITTGFVMMGMMTPMINAMLAGLFSGGDGDDDELKSVDWYWNLPEWVRRNNLILGNGEWYIAIPLPVEFRAPYGIGDITGSAFLFEKTPNRKFGNVSLDILSTAANILPVNPVEGYNGNLGDAALRAVAPDAGMFFVDWATNRDYTGRPLWKENPFSNTVPMSQGAYGSTPKGIVTACQKLAQVSNGAIDIPPGLVRDAMNNYGGGFFRAAEGVSKIMFGLLGNDPERPARWDDIPFLSGFSGHLDEDRSDSFATNALYEYKDVSDGVVKSLNAVLETDDVTTTIAYDNPDSLYDMATTVFQKGKIKRILESKDYALGREYRNGMNDEYLMKQHMNGPKAGSWYKSEEVKRKGVDTLRKEWKSAREVWASLPDKTEEEKAAKADAYKDVTNAWHLYYDAKANLVDKLMDIEYNYEKQ